MTLAFNQNETWEPITACNLTSTGCKNCYAKELETRRACRYIYPDFTNYQGDKLTYFKTVNTHLQLEDPSKIVYWMKDPFEKNTSNSKIKKELDKYGKCKRPIWKFLTSKPEQFINKLVFPDNVCIGVEVENQEDWDLYMPYLKQIKAKHRFVSLEQLQTDINMHDISCLAWCIVGSGSLEIQRLSDKNWLCNICGQCQTANVPLYHREITLSL